MYHRSVNVFAGLCSWAINIIRFYEVFCDVEPKRKALAAANAELAAAQEKLTKIKAKIKVCVLPVYCRSRSTEVLARDVSIFPLSSMLIYLTMLS